MIDQFISSREWIEKVVVALLTEGDTNEAIPLVVGEVVLLLQAVGLCDDFIVGVGGRFLRQGSSVELDQRFVPHPIAYGQPLIENARRGEIDARTSGVDELQCVRFAEFTVPKANDTRNRTLKFDGQLLESLTAPIILVKAAGLLRCQLEPNSSY